MINYLFKVDQKVLWSEQIKKFIKRFQYLEQNPKTNKPLSNMTLGGEMDVLREEKQSGFAK
jgi:uncharacterized protein YabN with tetrapyrrole methylase and pyrophosphatase domain